MQPPIDAAILYASGLLLILLAAVQGAGQSSSWVPPCPHECFCNEAPAASISDDWMTTPLAADQLWRSVICIQQHDTDVETLLPRLPPQTQALKIIQAPDATAIKLQSNHFAHFEQLLALSLQGRSESTSGLVLHADTLRRLVQLRYLSLKSLQLLDEPSEPLLLVDELEGDEEEVAPVNGGGNNRLVYLKEDVQEEILPYEQFKKLKDGQQQLWDGFTTLQRLEYLGVVECQLPEAFTRGHSAAFSTLSNMKEMVIRSCELRVRLETGQTELMALVSLSLADNQLLDLEPGDLQGMDNLRSLDLSANKLSRIIDYSLPYLPHLETLDLSNNPLEIIFSNAFINVTNVRRLFLMTSLNNSIIVRPGSFTGLYRVQELRLGPAYPADETDGLTAQLFADLTSLTELTLRGRWSIIEAFAFATNRRLQILDLKSCGIRRVSVDTFQSLPKLRLLDLSGNEFHQLPPGLFDPLLSLKELWLQDNQLITLPFDLFKPLVTSTKLIRLEANPWHCTCALNSWESTRVNKIKNLDNNSNRTVYQYDKRVTPLCATPKQFSGLAVFDVMRKQLGCDKNKMEKNSIQHSLPEWNEPLQEEVDHGPEATSDEDAESLSATAAAAPKAMALVSETTETAFEDQDIIDHGEEIIQDPPAATVRYSTVDNNLPEGEVDGQKIIIKSESSLSKKALKLRQQTQMLKKSNY